MSTELDTPVSDTITVTTQVLDYILMNLTAGEIEFKISNVTDEGNTLNSKIYFQSFTDMPAGAAKDDFKDVVANVRAYARSNGYLGEGTDSDPIENPPTPEE